MHVSAIGAPHLVDPSRLESQRTAALRRRVRHALGRARARAGGERRRRRRRGRRARVLPDPRPCLAPRLLPRVATARSTPGTRPACASCRAPSCCPRRRRPRSTSRPGRSTHRRDPRALAGAARADPFRRRRGPATPPRGAAASGSRAGLSASATGADEARVRASSQKPTSAPDREAYEQAMPFWQSYAGLKRYWEKRAEAA